MLKKCISRDWKFTEYFCCCEESSEFPGIYSGDPCNENQFTSNTCHAY